MPYHSIDSVRSGSSSLSGNEVLKRKFFTEKYQTLIDMQLQAYSSLEELLYKKQFKKGNYKHRSLDQMIKTKQQRIESRKEKLKDIDSLIYKSYLEEVNTELH